MLTREIEYSSWKASCDRENVERGASIELQAETKKILPKNVLQFVVSNVSCDLKGRNSGLTSVMSDIKMMWALSMLTVVQSHRMDCKSPQRTQCVTNQRAPPLARNRKKSQKFHLFLFPFRICRRSFLATCDSSSLPLPVRNAPAIVLRVWGEKNLDRFG